MNENDLSYFVHKLDKLWVKVEELEKRLLEIEKKLSSPEQLKTPTPQAQVPSIPAQTPAKTVVSQNLKAEDPVIQLLRERGPMNLVQINAALKEMGINESARDTLFKRIKGLMEAGKVGFDQEKQVFFLQSS